VELTPKKIIILASGSGSNAENIVLYFKNHFKKVAIMKVFCNKKNAGVFEKMEKLNIPIAYLPKEKLESQPFLSTLKNDAIDLIILAGFLLKIPKDWIKAFPKKIINIHPALLPKFGGKGMYGNKVHKAVKESNEKETGITIHYVNENYDEGAIIFQKSVPIDRNENVNQLAKKVQNLEHKYYSKTIDKLLFSKVNE